MNLLHLVILTILSGTVSSYVYRPSDPFRIMRNSRGLMHYVGCRMIYKPIRLYHSKCNFSRHIVLYGCSGYCKSNSNLMYRNPWQVYQLDRKCFTCDANPNKIRKFHIGLCSGVTIEIPVPSSCNCRRCSTDLLR